MTDETCAETGKKTIDFDSTTCNIMPSDVKQMGMEMLVWQKLMNVIHIMLKGILPLKLLIKNVNGHKEAYNKFHNHYY